jgi:TFIIF-interacting CTD phosphatase-like protein
MIKAKSHKLNKVLPVQDFHKKVLVLDLDETLIHTSYTVPPRHDLEVDVY